MNLIFILQISPKRVDRQQQKGMSLIMVLLILIVVSMLGVGGAQIAMLSERGARNDRDMQLAFQSAEAALIDAQTELCDPSSLGTGCTVVSDRQKINGRDLTFDGQNVAIFNSATATTGQTRGLWPAQATGKPAWLTVDFTDTSDTAPSAYLGQFTHANFTSGTAGVQPAKPPRYIIEAIQPVNVTGMDATANKDPLVLYRVTAMGFGTRGDIQAVVQMLYRTK